MAATDVLKSFRDKSYLQDSGKDEKKDGMDSGEENSSNRTIKLSDEEQKAFEQAKPGEDLVCEVHGNLLGKDGQFRVMSVSPMNGAPSYGGQDEQAMAGMVAQRVQPNIAPSPS